MKNTNKKTNKIDLILIFTFIVSFIIFYFPITKMAYNFNPRERQRRTMKFDEYERLGMIRWTMVPIGQVDINKKYLTACGPAYQSYNECLKKTLFDK